MAKAPLQESNEARTFSKHVSNPTGIYRTAFFLRSRH